MSPGEKSQDGYYAITPVCVDICPPIISVEKKPSQRKKASSRVSPCHLYYFTWKRNKARFLESSDSDIKKLVRNAVPESTKKVNKVCCQQSLKVKKGTSRHSDLVLRKLKLSSRLKEKLHAQYNILNAKVKRSARADKRRFVENLASEAAAAAQYQEQGTIYRITK